MSWLLWLGLLVAANAALFLLPLLPALAEWRRRSLPLHIPFDDEAGIIYFADRFRQRLAADWGNALLFAPAAGPSTAMVPIGQSLHAIAAQLPTPVRRQYRIAEAGEVVKGVPRLGTAEQPTLIGDVVRLAVNTHYVGEIYARDRLHALGGNVIRAVLCDGAIELDRGCGVLRWAHGRSIVVAEGSRAMGRLSAIETIAVGQGCSFERLSAPVLWFGGSATKPPASPASKAGRTLVAADFPDAGIEYQPGSSRWLCDGDLAIPDDSVIDGSLVVRGRLRIGARSRIHGSLKAHGEIVIATDCRIDGAVFADGAISIAERCQLNGPLASAGHVMLGDDCVVGRPGRPTSVVAPTITVGRCTCHGVTWARRNGRTTP